ncbi:hypothetical protein MCAP1_001398 [Malassezia caprae]|uniref:Uncharacterized protein n=1 Tax=Malassezia caprae TaxID=1381934 RepID=A0AAF0E6N5_9BASI|nr:hypothetical protein MCAP1_001398 [Malassezia caprae]
MNPWASPWDDAAGAPALDAPPLDLGSSSPPPLASAALAPVDVDPWGGESSSVAAQAAPEPAAADIVADSVPLDEPPNEDAPVVDTQLASLTSASLILHENVWGSGETMQTAWTAPAEPAPAEPAPAEPAPSEPAPPEPAPSEPAPAQGTELHEAPAGVSDDPAPTSEPSEPAKGSTLGRLSTAVAEWRKARVAAAEKAKEAKEAEQAKGWKKVSPPKPAATARLASWLRRSADSAPTSPARTPRARSPEKSTASSAGAPLGDDDLAWLEAASSRTPTARSSMERTAVPRAARGVRRYDAMAYDPDPRYDYDPPATYDADDSAAPAPVAHDPYMYDPDDDTDGFGEMQQYTDDAPASPPLGTYADEPRRAPLPPPPARAPSVDLLSASPPAAPAPARAPRPGALTQDDMSFFETI